MCDMSYLSVSILALISMSNVPIETAWTDFKGESTDNTNHLPNVYIKIDNSWLSCYRRC